MTGYTPWAESLGQKWQAIDVDIWMCFQTSLSHHKPQELTNNLKTFWKDFAASRGLCRHLTGNYTWKHPSQSYSRKVCRKQSDSSSRSSTRTSIPHWLKSHSRCQWFWLETGLLVGLILWQTSQILGAWILAWFIGAFWSILQVLIRFESGQSPLECPHPDFTSHVPCLPTSSPSTGHLAALVSPRCWEATNEGHIQPEDLRTQLFAKDILTKTIPGIWSSALCLGPSSTEVQAKPWSPDATKVVYTPWNPTISPWGEAHPIGWDAGRHPLPFKLPKVRTGFAGLETKRTTLQLHQKMTPRRETLWGCGTTPRAWRKKFASGQVHTSVWQNMGVVGRSHHISELPWGDVVRVPEMWSKRFTLFHSSLLSLKNLIQEAKSFDTTKSFCPVLGNSASNSRIKLWNNQFATLSENEIPCSKHKHIICSHQNFPKFPSFFPCGCTRQDLCRRESRPSEFQSMDLSGCPCKLAQHERSSQFIQNWTNSNAVALPCESKRFKRHMERTSKEFAQPKGWQTAQIECLH